MSDLAMSPPNSGFERDRRSSRIFIRIPVQAEGRNIHGSKFREKAETIVVNAHGALVYLNEALAMGAMVTLTNPVTEEALECRVVYLGDSAAKGQRVGFEFLSPAPRFWGVEFPPDDWTRSSTSNSSNN
jgi:hypothetical protein